MKLSKLKKVIKEEIQKLQEQPGYNPSLPSVGEIGIPINTNNLSFSSYQNNGVIDGLSDGSVILVQYPYGGGQDFASCPEIVYYDEYRLYTQKIYHMLQVGDGDIPLRCALQRSNVSVTLLNPNYINSNEALSGPCLTPDGQDAISAPFGNITNYTPNEWVEMCPNIFDGDTLETSIAGLPHCDGIAEPDHSFANEGGDNLSAYCYTRQFNQSAPPDSAPDPTDVANEKEPIDKGASKEKPNITTPSSLPPEEDPEKDNKLKSLQEKLQKLAGIKKRG